jgi:hypothetical protein
MADRWLFFLDAGGWLTGRGAALFPVQSRIPNSAPLSPSHCAGSAATVLFPDRVRGCRCVPTASHGAA